MLALAAPLNCVAGPKTSTIAMLAFNSLYNSRQDRGGPTSSLSRCTHSKHRTDSKGNSVDWLIEDTNIDCK